MKYIAVSIPLFLIWLIPNIVAQVEKGNSQTSHIATYIGIYYHGFHLRRMLQLVGDSLIQFEKFLIFRVIIPLKYLAIPLFLFLYLHKNLSKYRFKLCFLIVLWFLVPLLVFTTYSGEISDYYFSINVSIALIILSYFIDRLFVFKNLLIRVALVGILFYYAFINLNEFSNYKNTIFYNTKIDVFNKVKEGIRVKFSQGDPESYFYYYYMREQKGIEVY